MDTDELVRASLRATASEIQPTTAAREELRAALTRRAARSRRLAVTLAVVSAAAVVAIACVAPVAVHHLGHGPAATHPPVVPWEPLDPSDLASQNPATCAAGSLSATMSHHAEPVMGQDRIAIRVTNAGPTCGMPNEQVSLVTHAAGTSLLAHPRSARKEDVPIIRHDRTVTYLVTFGPACTDAAAAQPATVPAEFELAGTALAGATLAEALAHCHHIGVTAPDTALSDRDPYTRLDATISLPATVSGTTVSFTITLTNTGTTSYDYRPCPTYREVVSADDGTRTTASYALNCADAPALPPGGSATFAMQADVPGTTGAVRVGWYLADGVPSALGTTTLDN